MIVFGKYVYAHLPRTGGTFIHKIFKNTGLYQYVEFIDNIEWPQEVIHSPFWHRPMFLRGRIPILGFRRLGDWYASLQRGVFHGGWYPKYKIPITISEEQLVDSEVKQPKNWTVELYGPVATLADFYISLFLKNVNEDDIIWWRTEHLLCDMKEVLGDNFMEKAIKKKHRDSLSHSFSEEIIKKMRLNNPRWADIESRIYLE